MPNRLVTVATFDLAPEARAARNALVDAGIRAVVADEESVAMVWELANALGGVKVQVWEEDVERASQVLADHLGTDAEIDEEAFAAEAVAAVSEEDLDEDRAAVEPPDTPESIALTERENDARRLFFAGWLGIIFSPAAFYSLYLLLITAFGHGEMSSRGRFNLLVGALLTFTSLALCLTYLFLFRGTMILQVDPQLE